MKLSKKKWKSLISGVLLAASASSFLIAPVYAADYSKPLIGTLKKDSEILSPDGNTVTENDGKLIYDFQGKTIPLLLPIRMVLLPAKTAFIIT